MLIVMPMLVRRPASTRTRRHLPVSTKKMCHETYHMQASCQIGHCHLLTDSQDNKDFGGVDDDSWEVCGYHMIWVYRSGRAPYVHAHATQITTAMSAMKPTSLSGEDICVAQSACMLGILLLHVLRRIFLARRPEQNPCHVIEASRVLCERLQCMSNSRCRYSTKSVNFTICFPSIRIT